MDVANGFLIFTSNRFNVHPSFHPSPPSPSSLSWIIELKWSAGRLQSQKQWWCGGVVCVKMTTAEADVGRQMDRLYNRTLTILLCFHSPIDIAEIVSTTFSGVSSARIRQIKKLIHHILYDDVSDRLRWQTSTRFAYSAIRL